MGEADQIIEEEKEEESVDYQEQAILRQLELNARRNQQMQGENGIGIVNNFGSIQVQYRQEQVKKIICRVIFELILQALLLSLFRGYDHKTLCSIPLVQWCKISCYAQIAKSILTLNLIWLASRSSATALKFSLFLELASLLFGTGWVIWGYTLYFSKKNDCTSSFPLTYMMICLIFGFFLILMMILLLCVLPCLLIAVRNSMNGNQGIDGDQQNDIISSLQRRLYDPQ